MGINLNIGLCMKYFLRDLDETLLKLMATGGRMAEPVLQVWACSCLRYILVGNHNGLEKVIKNSKRLGVQTILEEIFDLDWECFKGNEAENLQYLLGLENAPK